MTGTESGRYTHGHAAEVVASHSRRTAQNSAGYLLDSLRQGQSVLDVGCGPATITLDLARLVAPGRVVGLENAEAALTAARAEAERRGDRTTEFLTGDALALPFDDDSFDVVHAHQVLQHVTDPVAALREMARVARPGGVVAARDADYAAMSWYPELPGLELWRQLYRRVARANGAEPDAGRRLRSWSLQAGLTEISVTTSAWTYADEASVRWWGESQATRFTSDSFAEQAIAVGASTDEVAAIGADFRAWSQAPDGYFVIVHTEVLARV